MCVYIYIYIYIYTGFLDYTRDPVIVRRFPEMFGDLCKNKTNILYIFMEHRFLPYISVDNRSPYPSTHLMFGCPRCI